MSLVTKSLSLGLVLGLLASGCGAPKASAKKQPSGSVKMPEFPRTDTGFFAVSNPEGNRTFTGTLVLFSQNADPLGLKNVLLSSKQRLEANAVFVKALSDAKLEQDKTKLQALKAESVQLNRDADKEAREMGASSDPMVIAAQAQEAQLWFAKQLKTLNLSSEDEVEAKAFFAGYCEAKIWEIATSKLILQVNFLERPSPFQICEGYYREQNFFDPNSEFCQAGRPSIAGGGNYFRCLWLEGLLKTGWYRKLDARNLDLIRSWVISDREELRNGLQGQWYKNSTDTLLQPMPQGAQTKLINAVMQFKVMPGLKFPHMSSGLFKAFQMPTPLSLEFKRPFKVEETMPTTLIALDNYDTETLENGDLRMLVNANVRFMSPLFEQMIYMGARSAPKSQLFMRSVADARFQKVAEDSITNLPQVISPSDALKPYAEAFFRYPRSKEAQARVDAKDLEVQAMALTIKEKKDHLRELEGAYFKQTDNGIVALNQGGLAKLFLAGLDLHISRRGGKLGYFVTLPVSDVPEQEIKFKASCIDLVTQAAVAECHELLGKEERQLDTTHASLSFDQASGLMVIDYALDDPKKLGFEHRERTEAGNAAFNDFSEEELKAKRIRLELYPNRVQDTLEVLSGKAFLLDADGKKLEEGNVILSETYDGSALSE